MSWYVDYVTLCGIFRLYVGYVFKVYWSVFTHVTSGHISLRKKKVFALQKSLSPSGLIWIPTWRTFHCLGTPIWPTDFTGKHCLRLLSVRSCDSTAYPSVDLFTHKQFILVHHFMDISTLVKLLAGLFICDQ